MKNKAVKRLKLLYVAPRYHTNQVPVMRGFHKYDCQVMFMAQYEGINEVHDNVDFRLLKSSWITELIFKIVGKKYGRSEAEGIKTRLFIPAFFHTVQTIRKFAPDIVILRERYLYSFVIYWICKMLGIKKTILYVQQPIYDADTSENKLKNMLKEFLFPKAAFSPIFYHGRNRSKNRKSNVYFVPLVVEGKNASAIAGRDYFKNDVIHFLDIGKYREYKNHFFLIDVFASLKDKGVLSNVKLTIIGQVSNDNEEDYFARLKKYIFEKGLDEIIEVRRNIPFEEMDALYREHDVLLLTSTYESAGMVIPEAMEQGLCVVTSIYCGLASYLEEYQCGYTFNLDSTQSMEEIMTRLIADRKEIKEMGQKSCQMVQEHLLFENYLEKLNDVTESEFGYTIWA